MEILVVDDELTIRGEGCVPSDGNLRAHVSRLRGKLTGGLTIDAIRGRGYALIGA